MSAKDIILSGGERDEDESEETRQLVRARMALARTVHELVDRERRAREALRRARTNVGGVVVAFVAVAAFVALSLAVRRLRRFAR